MEFIFNVTCRDGYTVEEKVISLFSNDWIKCQYEKTVRELCERKNLKMKEYEELVDKLEDLSWKSNFVVEAES